MIGWFFILLLVATTDTSNELLDYIPTDAYWQQKAVPVSVQRMIDEISMSDSEDVDALIAELASDQFAARDLAARKLIAMGSDVAPKLEAAGKSQNPEMAARAGEILSQLNSQSKEAAVRRLMAIRTLGELKAKEALPELRKSLQSREMFVAEYAGRAIHAIDPAAQAAPQAGRPAARDADVWLLPRSTGLVAQIALERTDPIDYKAIAEKFPQEMIPAEPDGIINQLVGQIVSFADQVGNLRIDIITLGLSDNFSGSAGWINVTVRGTYDAKAVVRFLTENAGIILHEDGSYFAMDEATRLFFPSNERFAVLAGPEAEGVPVAEFIQAMSGNAGGIGENAPLAELIRAADKTGPVWAAIVVSPSMRDAVRMLKDVKSLTAETAVIDTNTRLVLTFAGDDPAALQKSVESFVRVTRKSADEARDEDAANPLLKPIIQAFRNVTSEIKGDRAIVTFNYESTSPLVVLATPFIATRVDMEAEAEIEVDQAPAEPALPHQ